MHIRLVLVGFAAMALGLAAGSRAQMPTPLTPPSAAAASRRVPATQINPGLTRYTATSLPARLEVPLDPAAMWSALPPQVKAARQGPDGRVWLEVDVRGGALTREGARELVRREYGQKMPQMSLIRPILFEPTGRIWFKVQSGQVSNEDSAQGALIGYDGKTFIERTDLRDDQINPEWGGDGRIGGTPAAWVAEHAFFCTPGTVHVYDGKDWTTHELPGTPVRNGYAGNALARGHLYVEPDGQGVIYVDRDASKPVWRWRAGQWVRYSTGILNDPSGADRGLMGASSAPEVLGAAARQHGLWLLTSSEGLTYIPFDQVEAATSQPVTIASLIQCLAAAETREGAAQELMLHGKSAEADVQRALDSANDPQRRALLEQILAALPKEEAMDRGMPDQARVHRAWQFGPYMVSSVNYVFALPGGATVIAADRVVDAAGKAAVTQPVARNPDDAPRVLRRAPGVLIQDPGGTVRALADYKLVALLRPTAPSLRPPGESPAPGLLAVDGGKRLWTLGDIYSDPPGLLDPATGRIVDRVPLPAIYSVAAVSDGVLFLMTDAQRTGGRPTVLAYRSTGKDFRRSVEPITQTVAKSTGSAYSLNCTGDGCYWFTEHAADPASDDIFARFDGTSVQVYPDARIVNAGRPEGFTILPGSDGILVVTKTTCLLVTPRGIHRAATVESLIAENTAEVARVFSGPVPIRIGDLPATVRADSAGNIWLVQRPPGELKVFARGAWLSAADALRTAGDVRGQALLFMPVGQDRKMLVIDRDPWSISRQQRGKTSFLVSLQDKMIVAEPVPDIANPRLSAEVAYSPSGDPWLDSSPDPEKPFPTSVCRMTVKGPVNVIDNANVLTGDGAGDLWLAVRPPSAEHEETRLYRDGVFIPAAAHTPGAYGRLWAVPGGRLCYMSVLGLQVLRSRQHAGALIWDTPEILRFAGIESASEVHAISPRGFVVVSPTRAPQPDKPNLFFYPIERP